jgi:uncharacterized membrane protein
MEAFSDGVIAIIITIMVLEMKVPHGEDISTLKPLIPVFSSYLLSFIFIGIYWNNHHHLMQIVQKVNGSILWANLHLLFWLSLTPFVTGWMGENGFAQWPVFMYGIVMLFSGIAYYILTLALVAHHGKDSKIAIALGKDVKGKLSLILYASGVAISFINSWVALSLYISVSIIWFVPDLRMEKTLADKNN